MGKTLIKSIMRVICAMLCMALFLPCTAFAAESETVTVAYIDYNSFIEKSDDGSYTGYGADYLNRIAAYTGWQYDFVDMDWPTAYQAVKNGSVDFYCVARFTPEREQELDFSLYQVCDEEMNIYVLPNTEIYYDDFEAFGDMRFGVLEGSNELQCFKEYAAENDFTCEITEYPSNNAVLDALNSGEIDAAAVVKYSISGEYKLVGNFGISPAYMMSCNNSEKMIQFNKAQERLRIDDPTFTQELEKKYYGEERHVSLLLTREEAEYIENCPTLTVALSSDMAPVEYYDTNTGAFRGITVDLYERISELTGLQFEFVRREDSETLIAQMGDGAVQLIGSLAKSEHVAQALRIKQTNSFSENSMSIVAKDFSTLTSDSVAAIPAGYPQFLTTAQQNGYTNVVTFDTFEECVSAVDSGEADLTYIINMCEGVLLDHASYSELRSMQCIGTDYGICLGVSDTCDARLLSILNKSISTISSRDINDIIVENTASAKSKDTVADFMVKNGVLLLAVCVVLIALIVFAVLRSQKARQQQKLNQKLQAHHDFLQHLIDTLPCGVFRYSYDAPHRILSYNEACARIYGYGKEGPFVGQTPDTVVKEGTESDFQKKFEICEQTEGSIRYEWPITKQDGSEGFVECIMDIVETEQGKLFQEVSVDITERVLNDKLTEKRYMQEQRRSRQLGEKILYSAFFDISEQVLKETSIDTPAIHAGMSVAEFVEGLLPELCDLQTEEQIEDFRTRFTADRLQRDYDNGFFEQSFLLRRRKDGKFAWLRSDLTLRLNPVDGHLMCFDYIFDVTDEQVTNIIMRSMALEDCEELVCIDGVTKRCYVYTTGENGELSRDETLSGQAEVIGRITMNMTEDAARELLSKTTPAEVYKHLENDRRYQVFATVADADGKRRDKALTFFYTDRKNSLLALTITDVTEVRAEEVRHAQLLSDALAAAEKADAAKSQFLSRVSHEMRTPLNAIIGFIELAKDADAEKAANYLASSDMAAKQLLSVINDVLDMSSIESGKLKISNSSFNFRHLISSITNIYGTQCKQKGVNFETRIASPTEEWLVGDELRVNQILMNLLGNAIKFTSEGCITLSVSQTAIEEDKVFIRFTVADSGCGMSEEMKKRLFKPFEQESASTARKFGGNGLGLSIVKSLVTMMNGSIRVESKQGEGTVFTVDLPFGRSDVVQDNMLPKSIESLRILVVDDEASEREYMSLVLTRMGVRYDCVESGAEALLALDKSEKDNDLYNVCLVDWRMPEMNGFETTNRIREKFGKDLVVIVVSAYEFHQADESAKEAGANLFLSKPIFQSALFDLFMTLTGGKIAKPKKEPQAWDFTGRRVLLAEDNVLNQIVAKGYLAKDNVVVELAEDGQAAVDMFLASAPGYYDAILMDIQMPELDGYEATRAIRASDHLEAKTIQIIAQTADAFNEDISRALSAGMNSHVSKPIKPDVLAKALHKAFGSK